MRSGGGGGGGPAAAGVFQKVQSGQQTVVVGGRGPVRVAAARPAALGGRAGLELRFQLAAGADQPSQFLLELLLLLRQPAQLFLGPLARLLVLFARLLGSGCRRRRGFVCRGWGRLRPALRLAAALTYPLPVLHGPDERRRQRRLDCRVVDRLTLPSAVRLRHRTPC